MLNAIKVLIEEFDDMISFMETFDDEETKKRLESKYAALDVAVKLVKLPVFQLLDVLDELENAGYYEPDEIEALEEKAREYREALRKDVL